MNIRIENPYADNDGTRVEYLKVTKNELRLLEFLVAKNFMDEETFIEEVKEAIDFTAEVEC